VHEKSELEVLPFFEAFTYRRIRIRIIFFLLADY
jgi:hypothetical protein